MLSYTEIVGRLESLGWKKEDGHYSNRYWTKFNKLKDTIYISLDGNGDLSGNQAILYYGPNRTEKRIKTFEKLLEKLNSTPELTPAKPDLTAVPTKALVAAAKTFMWGRTNKYNECQFLDKKTGETTESKVRDNVAAAMRHINQHNAATVWGNYTRRGAYPVDARNDHESGLPHLYHALARLMMAIEISETA